MRKVATKTCIAIIIFFPLASLAAPAFELKFKTMTLPPNADVQIDGSTARVGGGRLGIETVWNCSCNKNNGSCSLEQSKGNSLSASRHPATPAKAIATYLWASARGLNDVRRRPRRPAREGL